MRWGPKYRIKIRWNNGAETEGEISAKQRINVQRYGTLYLMLKYELEEDPEAIPVDYDVLEAVPAWGIYYLHTGGKVYKVRGRLEDAIMLLKIAGEGEVRIL